MSLTVSGFAAPRTVPLRGKGGDRRRGDNGVSPPAPRDSRVAVADETYAAAIAPPPSRSRATASQRSERAAVEWQESHLPLLGRLWATAWLPAVLLAACLVSLVYLLQTSGIATTGYDLQRLQVERNDWQLRNEQLRLELAKRRSLTWIEAEATGRLGMVRPEPTALTYLKIAR